MVSALSALENSVAVFEVPTAGVQEDPETGNVVPVNETLTYRLYLRRGASTSPGGHEWQQQLRQRTARH